MSVRKRSANATIGALIFALCASQVSARGADTISSAPFGPPIEDQAVYVHVIANQLEGRFGAGGNGFRWQGEAWAGTDTNRLWLKSEGEVNRRGDLEDGQQELFYDRPLTSYFDLQAGVRSDLDSVRGRTWAALGIQGLAPYFFEVSATVYASDGAHYAARLEGSTDLLLTQRLILQPQIEMNFYTKADPARRIGSGLSAIDTGLRLRYEVTRKFAPYIGLTYDGKFGGTADFARAAGERSGELRFTVGLRTWL